jgi:hypothetical protein
MSGTISPPPPAAQGADDDKRRSVHIQVGRHLDVNVGVYVSPQALMLLCSLGAGAGVGTWFGFLNH